MKAVTVIPAYNCAKTLPRVVSSAQKQVQRIVVVDDGSSDETASVARRLGAEVVRHEYNQGKGVALRSGFLQALNTDCDVIITLDADGQHDPVYIPAFLESHRQSGADLIIGSRRKQKINMPWDRRFSNFTTSIILSVLLKTSIEDSQSGYRLISRKLLESITLQSRRFEIETEMIIKAVKGGFRISHIPIIANYDGAPFSQINRLHDTVRWCRAVLESI